MIQHVAMYVRVSTARQSTKSQEPDLQRWENAFADGRPVRWYRDKATGTTMERPGWQRLEADVDAGKVSTVVVWRLDRLGRTASGLTALFEKLSGLGVNLISVRDSIDLSTASGRLIANVLASVAAYETEVRGERARAGIAACKARGMRWGGSEKGRLQLKTRGKVDVVRKLKAQGESIAAIARATSLGRPTIYRILGESVKASAK